METYQYITLRESCCIWWWMTCGQKGFLLFTWLRTMLDFTKDMDGSFSAWFRVTANRSCPECTCTDKVFGGLGVAVISIDIPFFLYYHVLVTQAVDRMGGRDTV